MLWNNSLGKWESPEEKKKREDSVKLEKEKAVKAAQAVQAKQAQSAPQTTK